MVEADTFRQLKQIGWLVLGWLVIALVVLLAPSPREWGTLGHRISPFYDDIKSVLQPAVHIVLMASMAALCMHIFRQQTVPVAAGLSFAIVIALAAVFEGLQSLLPLGFARRGDLADMIPSAAGALMGCMIGLGTPLIKNNRSRKRR